MTYSNVKKCPISFLVLSLEYCPQNMGKRFFLNVGGIKLKYIHIASRGICSYGLSLGFANDEITSPDNGCVRPYTDIPLSDQLGVERMSSLQSNCFSVMIVLFMIFLDRKSVV